MPIFNFLGLNILIKYNSPPVSNLVSSNDFCAFWNKEIWTKYNDFQYSQTYFCRFNCFKWLFLLNTFINGCQSGQLEFEETL